MGRLSLCPPLRYHRGGLTMGVPRGSTPPRSTATSRARSLGESSGFSRVAKCSSLPDVPETSTTAKPPGPVACTHTRPIAVCRSRQLPSPNRRKEGEGESTYRPHQQCAGASRRRSRSQTALGRRCRRSADRTHERSCRRNPDEVTDRQQTTPLRGKQEGDSGNDHVLSRRTDSEPSVTYGWP